MSESNKLHEAFQKACQEKEEKKIRDEAEKQLRQKAEKQLQEEAEKQRRLSEQKAREEELKTMPEKLALSKKIWERVEWLSQNEEVRKVFKKNRTSEIKIGYSKLNTREYQYIHLLAYGALRFQTHWNGMWGGGSHPAHIIISIDELVNQFNFKYIEELHDLLMSDTVYSKIFNQLS